MYRPRPTDKISTAYHFRESNFGSFRNPACPLSRFVNLHKNDAKPTKKRARQPPQGINTVITGGLTHQAVAGWALKSEGTIGRARAKTSNEPASTTHRKPSTTSIIISLFFNRQRQTLSFFTLLIQPPSGQLGPELACPMRHPPQRTVTDYLLLESELKFSRCSDPVRRIRSVLPTTFENPISAASEIPLVTSADS